MSETRTAAITLKGAPFDVTGLQLSVGDTAPDFSLLNSDLKEVSLSSFSDKVRIIATVPSLDTSVCQQETKRFNDEIGDKDGVEVLVVSVDLPLTQKNWCGAEGIENVTTLSCHHSTAFGVAYGVHVANGPLEGRLARAVFVVDASGVISHVEYVTEVADLPNFDAVLNTVTS
ncbi:MAG: thiol peroxidase [Planctomycetota bacterium]|nr:thiol peroxidase [Planctomycetota bacterium]